MEFKPKNKSVILNQVPVKHVFPFYLKIVEVNGDLEISASALQKKIFCLAKFLFLPFEVSYEENIYGEVLFKYPCTPSWEFQPLFRAVIL